MDIHNFLFILVNLYLRNTRYRTSKKKEELLQGE